MTLYPPRQPAGIGGWRHPPLPRIRFGLAMACPTYPSQQTAKDFHPMTDTKLPLIHKAPVEALTLHVARARLAIGDHAWLERLSDGKIGVFATVRQLVLGFLPRWRPALLGHLGPVAEEIVAPSLAHGDPLRVRIIDLVPEHLSNGYPPEVYISVWGDPRHITPVLEAAGLLPEVEPKPPKRPGPLRPVQGS
jgi:hypothetical protein